MRSGRELILALLLLGAPSTQAADDLAVDVVNASEPTLCAEKDNVYLKLASPQVRRFVIEAGARGQPRAGAPDQLGPRADRGAADPPSPARLGRVLVAAVGP